MLHEARRTLHDARRTKHDSPLSHANVEVIVFAIDIYSRIRRRDADSYAETRPISRPRALPKAPGPLTCSYISERKSPSIMLHVSCFMFFRVPADGAINSVRIAERELDII